MTFSIPTQHTLVARLQEGGSEADWERFYRLYERPILAFAAAYSLESSDCSDVLQETMVKMLRGGFSRFDAEKGGFTGFLFNVVKGCVIDAIRRRARRQSRQVPIEQSQVPSRRSISSLSASPAEAAERQGQIALVSTVLDFLIERRCFKARTVTMFREVVLAAAEPREVATRYRTSTGNVYEAKRAVLARLRRMLLALDRGFDLEQALNE